MGDPVKTDARWLRLTSRGVPVYVPAAGIERVEALGEDEGADRARVVSLRGEFYLYVDQTAEAVMDALGVEVVGVAGGAS